MLSEYAPKCSGVVTNEFTAEFCRGHSPGSRRTPTGVVTGDSTKSSATPQSDDQRVLSQVTQHIFHSIKILIPAFYQISFACPLAGLPCF